MEKEKPTPTWDVSEEEKNRVILAANDCRRFNGGQIASKRDQAIWTSDLETKAEPEQYDILPGLKSGVSCLSSPENHSSSD
jgi:hypothetical protein